MYTRTFVRDNEMVKISDYGFQMFVDNHPSRIGLVEDIETDIEILILEGFCEVFEDER